MKRSKTCCAVCAALALQRWSRAGWEWRRVRRNVHVRSTQRATDDEQGGVGGPTRLRSWALWPVALCSSLWSGCWCACGCVSSWISPCQRPRLIAVPTPGRQTHRHHPRRSPSPFGPFVPSPSAPSAGDRNKSSCICKNKWINLCKEWVSTFLFYRLLLSYV